MVESNDPKQRLHDAIGDLIDAEPLKWPEILAAQAGAACLMDVGYLNHLADAAAEVAAMAHRMRQGDDTNHQN